MWTLPVATTMQSNVALRREGHLYEVFVVLAKTRLIKEQVLRAVLK